MAIHLIGTSHISSDSVDEVKQKIEALKPDIVAVELDKPRLAALKEKTGNVTLRAIPHIGFQGYLFAKLGAYVQKKLGHIVGVEPGSDMVAAVETGQSNGAKVALIDQDVRVTLKSFSKHFGFKDKINFLWDAVSGSMKRRMPFDVRKVPTDEVVDALLDMVEERYPGAYKALIGDRNKFMAHKLRMLEQKFPGETIVAVVGKGHVKGMKELLDEPQTITYSYSVS